jgi:hypothetical protein
MTEVECIDFNCEFKDCKKNSFEKCFKCLKSFCELHEEAKNHRCGLPLVEDSVEGSHPPKKKAKVCQSEKPYIKDNFVLVLAPDESKTNSKGVKKPVSKLGTCIHW